MEVEITEGRMSADMTRLHPGPARTLLLWALIAAAAAAAALSQGDTTQAHPCSTGTDDHRDSHERDCGDPGHEGRHGRIITAHGGLDQGLTLELTPPPMGDRPNNPYLEAGDKIELLLTGFDLRNPVDFGDSENLELIKVRHSRRSAGGGGVSAVETEVASQTLTLTLAAGLDSVPEAKDNRLIIDISAGTGILTPQAPRGFDERDDPYPIEAAFLDEVQYEDGQEPLPKYQSGDHHFLAVRNPLSTTVPGDRVRIELHTRSDTTLHGNEDVVVDFSGPTADTSFTLPESIDERNVTIAWDGRSPKNATTVVVQGGRVTITIPQDDDNPTEIDGNYIIAFKENAKIENPKAAGNRIISVYPASRPSRAHEIIAVVRRATTLEPARGPRGTAMTLEGKGYADGTVTIFEGEDRYIDAGERLGFANTVEGVFTLELTARGEPGSPFYRVWTLDGNGVYHSVDFPIESSMSFDPDRLRSGEELNVTVADWEREEHPALAAVTIGGIAAYAAYAVEYEECFELAKAGLHTPAEDGELSVRLRVPVTLPPGRQNVAAFGPDHVRLRNPNGTTSQKPHCQSLPSGEERGDEGENNPRELQVVITHDPVASRPIELVGRGLRVVPETGARGQNITIIGSGIARSSSNGRDIVEISIGGTPVSEDASNFEVPSSGQFALNVTVPDDAKDGTNEVRVVGREGDIAHGIITVESPALDVVPGGGRRGATFTASGTGFVAGGIISVYYGDGGDLSFKDQLLDAVVADRRGAFTLETTVPLDAELGVRHTVTAVARTPDGDRTGPVRARDDHTVSAGIVSTGSGTACAGDRLIITGTNLPQWSTVRWIELGGLRLSPGHMVRTDHLGAFTAEVTVPALELGNQTLRVLVAGTVYVDVIELVPPPLEGHPSRVLKEIILAGALERAWYLHTPSMTWSFYDPDPEYAEFNDLEHLRSGMIISMSINRQFQFQGETLYPGWNALELR